MKTQQARRERLQKNAFAKRLRVLVGRILLLLLAGGLVYWMGKGGYLFCLAKAIRTEPVKVGVLASKCDGRAIVLRNEAVVRAPAAGKLVRVVPEGSKVRAGTVVARLECPSDLKKRQETIELRSPSPGLVCYHPDAWEGVLLPEQWERLDYLALFKNITEEPQTDSQVCTAGEAVFKVIDNLSGSYLILRVEKAQGMDFTIGERLDLQWDPQGSGRARVVALKENPETRLVVVEMQEARPGLPDERIFDFRMTNRKYEGIIVSIRALVQKDRNLGVLLVSPAGIRFHKVIVIGIQGNQAAIRGIDPGSEIVLNPDLARRVYQKI